MKKKTYNLFVFIAFSALLYPLMSSILKKDTTPKLIGIVINNDASELNTATWFSGEYQSIKDDYNNDHWAFKEFFVRLNNQFYYNFFNQIRVKQFVSGKQNYVYSELAVQSYYGNDFIGEEKINEFLRKCKVVQDTLNKKGISLVLGYIPGKGFGAPQYIDDKYKQPIKHTNLQSFVAQSKKVGLNYIDYNAYYDEIKDTCKYPLYTTFAHHWTNYFDCLAAKKTIEYFEKLRHTDLPNMLWSNAIISDTARSRDADILNSMNLYKNPKQTQKLAYPEVQFENDSLKNNTRVLTIGDSYWYGIVYLNVPQYCFNGGQFWYYNNRVIPSPTPGEKTEVWQMDLKQSIESNQVIFIIGSDPALTKFGWGFIEDAYELYTSPKTYYAKTEKSKNIKQFEKQIREKPLLLKKATRKSEEMQIPLDSAIKLDAMKLAGLK